MGDITEDPDRAVDWLTLAEAAEQLGISLDAVRRRMRRGDFPKRQVRTRHGVTWQVRLVPADERDPGASLATTLVPTVAIEPTVQALLEYVRERDRQRDTEVAQLREDLAEARADLVDHASQLASANEQLRALQAPDRGATVDATLVPTLTAEERQELELLRAEHELHLRSWEHRGARVAQPWWQRLLRRPATASN